MKEYSDLINDEVCRMREFFCISISTFPNSIKYITIKLYNDSNNVIERNSHVFIEYTPIFLSMKLGIMMKFNFC